MSLEEAVRLALDAITENDLDSLQSVVERSFEVAIDAGHLIESDRLERVKCLECGGTGNAHEVHGSGIPDEVVGCQECEGLGYYRDLYRLKPRAEGK